MDRRRGGRPDQTTQIQKSCSIDGRVRGSSQTDPEAVCSCVCSHFVGLVGEVCVRESVHVNVLPMTRNPQKARKPKERSFTLSRTSSRPFSNSTRLADQSVPRSWCCTWGLAAVIVAKPLFLWYMELSGFGNELGIEFECSDQRFAGKFRNKQVSYGAEGNADTVNGKGYRDIGNISSTNHDNSSWLLVFGEPSRTDSTTIGEMGFRVGGGHGVVCDSLQ